MIAAAATIAVVYPHMNSIGGDGFWLISRARQGADRHRRVRPRGRAGDAGLVSRAGPRGDSVARAARGQHRRRRGVRMERRARRCRRAAAARTPAGGRDLVRARRDAGHAEPGRLHDQVPSTSSRRSPASPAAFLRDGAPPQARSLQRFPGARADVRATWHERGLDDFYRGELAQALGSRARARRQSAAARRPRAASRGARRRRSPSISRPAPRTTCRRRRRAWRR